MKRVLAFCLFLLCTAVALAASQPGRGPVRARALDLANPNLENRVHREGSIWMNVTNYGYFGNEGPEQNGAWPDPCLPEAWAPQAEFPGGSDQQYLYQGALWMGALVMDSGQWVPRVSVGTDGWFHVNELYPGEGEEHGIVERSNIVGKINCFGEDVYDPLADANEEFIATYSDTLTDEFWVPEDPVDGVHRPLNLEVTQRSMVWNSFEFNDFIIFEFTVRNMGPEFLRNAYLGLYMDADVGLGHVFDHHTDDISGFLAVDTLTGDTFNIAYSADNDGRPPNMSGPLIYPHVAGTYVLSTSQPDLNWSFNWWVSNGDQTLDFGPAWEAYCTRDSLDRGWTALYGTPVGDLHKYQVLSNREVDYDQIMTDRLEDVPPQHVIQPGGGDIWEPWCTDDPSPDRSDIADGYDTKYLMSCGPLGVFDYIDPQGNRIYRLNPGEEFTFTFAYVMGRDFHNASNPQIPFEPIDPTKFDFTNLLHNARRARLLYESNYAYQPPVYPPDFRPSGVFSGAVPLAWNPPSVGTVQGYNVYGRNSDTTVQFNAQLITQTSYTVSDLTNGDEWIFLAQTVDDSGIVSGYADTLVRVGAPLPVTGLTAQLDSSVVHLSWTANTDPALTNYRVLRRSNVPTDSMSFVVNGTAYTDDVAQIGRIYTYWVVAENSRNLLSFAVDSVVAIPWDPQRRILVIDDTDPMSAGGLLQGGVMRDSVTALYQRLMNASGEDFDVFLQNADPPAFTFEQMAQYDIVIWHSENNLGTLNDQAMREREDVLSMYVEAGGRLLRVGRRLLGGTLPLAGHNTGHWVEEWLQPLTFDSAYGASRFTPSVPCLRMTGATAADPGFPSVMLDSVKLHSLTWGSSHYYFLPEIDVLWPRAPTYPLYRSVVHETDSSGFVNQPVAVIGYGEIILGFPLYFLQEVDAQAVLNASINALRTYNFDVPEVPTPAVPTTVALYQNYPNPFNATTTLKFDLPQAGDVKLAIYNVLGQQVAVLLDEPMAAGAHALHWDAESAGGGALPSGIYLAHLQTATAARTVKLVLLR